MDYDAFLEKYNRLTPEYKLVIDTYVDFLVYSLKKNESGKVDDNDNELNKSRSKNSADED